MAITSSECILKTLSFGNTRSSLSIFEMSFAPTTWQTSDSKRDAIICLRCASTSSPSPIASPRYQAQWFNVHVDFPLFQRLALPIQVGTVKFPGIKIQDTRMIRLMKFFLHGGTRLAGWRATQMHQAILTSFHLSANRYGLPQLRYDLRKMKAHDLVQRDGHYTYRLTNKGVKVALLFLFFQKRLCGPLAHSLFHHRPDSKAHPKVPLEAAYHKADDAIQEIIQLLKAA